MSFRTQFKRLLRILDYAYLFFMLVVVAALLWAGAAFVFSEVLLMLFPLSGVGVLDIILVFLPVYIALIAGGIGACWGWKRWRRHLREEAQREAQAALRKPI
ncbi:MAG: hypothetical protein KY445_14235 [Armatimonadetes bacterium]|nr:hypothetical protein [Armatimonadota bacterium]